MRLTLLLLAITRCAGSERTWQPTPSSPSPIATTAATAPARAPTAEPVAQAEAPPALAESVPASPQETPATPSVVATANDRDTTECGEEWERKLVWINKNCQRTRTDVTTADTSRVVVTPGGGLANDTFTVAETKMTCPADAPDEMKRFAKSHRHCDRRKRR